MYIILFNIPCAFDSSTEQRRQNEEHYDDACRRCIVNLWPDANTWRSTGSRVSYLQFPLSIYLYNDCKLFSDLVYGYECRTGLCRKVELSEENFAKAISLPVCRLFCGSSIGTLWPKPTGAVQLEPVMRQIDLSNIKFQVPGTGKRDKLWKATEERWMDVLKAKIPNRKILKKGGYQFTVVINAPESGDSPRLTLDTDESYVLNIGSDNEGQVIANITANSFFGARHGLETLNQLVVYDDIRREVQVAANASISDAPVYKWRGLLLDTSRNYFSVKSIMRTLGKAYIN